MVLSHNLKPTTHSTDFSYMKLVSQIHLNIDIVNRNCQPKCVAVAIIDVLKRVSVGVDPENLISIVVWNPVADANDRLLWLHTRMIGWTSTISQDAHGWQGTRIYLNDFSEIHKLK